MHENWDEHKTLFQNIYEVYLLFCFILWVNFDTNFVQCVFDRGQAQIWQGRKRRRHISPLQYYDSLAVTVMRFRFPYVEICKLVQTLHVLRRISAKPHQVERHDRSFPVNSRTSRTYCCRCTCCADAVACAGASADTAGCWSQFSCACGNSVHHRRCWTLSVSSLLDRDRCSMCISTITHTSRRRRRAVSLLRKSKKFERFTVLLFFISYWGVKLRNIKDPNR